MPQDVQHNAIVEANGRCDCGAVTVRASGRILSMFTCACLNCQAVTGTGHSSIALLAADDISLTGETKPYTRDAASGARFTRHFCPVCGTTLHAQSSRAPGVSILPVGIFAGNNQWFKPKHLLFGRSRQPWDWLLEDLPIHETYPEKAAP
ncbi:GFA family protein [Devosia sp. WQ 349]|uniref:GFA family protein n=1 Tax=Devosia sp. WQ 349K1 TaxID=2800329 RepID=UPI001906849C|nr:GFA family protein [Devosia sp. WQ 349K1]MBK1793627.1 GFA family protein [Devosia sp. WQ 349K1]